MISPSATEEASTEAREAVNEEEFWPKLVEQTANVLKDNCFLKDIIATMELITRTHKLIAAIGNVDSKNTIHKILVQFDEWIADKDGEFVGEVSSAAVTHNTWEKCFKIAVYQSPSNKAAALDALFCIRSPKNDKQKAVIEANIRKLLDKKLTFKNGMDWIKFFDLKNFRAAVFDNIIYKAMIFGHEKLLKESFSKFSERLRCVRLLDECYKRADKDKVVNQLEKDFVNFITVKKLPALIQRVSNSHGINVEENKLYARHALFIEKTTVIYKAYDRCYFELYAVQALKSRNHQNKLDFFNIIYDDRKYAYCWAKYMQFKKRELPVFLNGCEHFEPDATEFVERISNAVIDAVDEDCIVNRKFWNKAYKLITVVSAEALNAFMEEYFIQTKPKVMGIDCEAGIKNGLPKVTVLQLATTEWICLIDIQLLSDKLSAEQWMNVFKHIFESDILRVGFSFSADFNYFCNEFPFLRVFFQQRDTKVLCLQKLANSITNLDGIFKSKIPVSCGLATLAKEILGIDMDKSLQNSNWTKRPLTHFQKLYAVSDALVVVLVHEKLRELLDEKLDDVSSDIWNKAYVLHNL